MEDYSPIKYHLRAEVVGSAQHSLGMDFCVHYLGNPKVPDLHDATSVQKDIGCFKISNERNKNI